ncbi:hypothetical protein MP228_011603 [Amoeboaphelidium protococcarum]|nr:hypothetical protein MP228_011603 [Amoeboaphelidium protococcarum]
MQTQAQNWNMQQQQQQQVDVRPVLRTNDEGFIEGGSSQSSAPTPVHSEQQSPSALLTIQILDMVKRCSAEEQFDIMSQLIQQMPLQQIGKLQEQIKAIMTPKAVQYVDFISQLPQELSVHIAQLLCRNLIDLQNAQLVSSRWKSVFSQESVYKTRFRFKQQVEDWKLNQKILKDHPTTWRHLCEQQERLQQRWRQLNDDGMMHIRHINGHRDGIYSVMYDGKNRQIISGSRDRTVRVWDIETGEQLHVMNGHSQSVLTVAFNDDLVVTGSSDSTIKVWDRRNQYALLHTIHGHSESVLNVVLDDDHNIVSASKDKTIKIWQRQLENDQWELITTCTGHKAAVNSISVQKGLMVSASGDRIIKVWDFVKKDGTCLRDLVGHARGIAAIHFDGTYVASGSSDQTIKLWNVHTGQLLKSFVAHSDLVRTLQFNNNFLISGGYDGVVKVWDMKRILHQSLPGSQSSENNDMDIEGGGVANNNNNGGGILLYEFQNLHTNRVFKIDFSWHYIISCSQDGRICVRDIAADQQQPVRSNSTGNLDLSASTSGGIDAKYFD